MPRRSESTSPALRSLPANLLRPIRRPRHRSQLSASAGRTVRPLTPTCPARVEGKIIDTKPTVLFLCTHNAAAPRWHSATSPPRRRQRDRLVRRIRTRPRNQPRRHRRHGRSRHRHHRRIPKTLDRRNRASRQRRHHHGLRRRPSHLPGKRYENWELSDPAGQGLDAVRPIRDDIQKRVHRLLAELNVPEPDDRENPREHHDTTATTSESAVGV